MHWLVHHSLYVFLGSAAGAAARYGVSGFVARRIGEAFPSGTLFVNVGGCAAAGFIAGWVHPLLWAHDPVAVFLTYGFLGGFTTVSSFAYQTMELARNREARTAAWNVTLTVLLSWTAVWVGWLLGRIPSMFLESLAQ